MATSKKHIPGSDAPSSVVFDFPFIANLKTVTYLKDHGHIMFIVRGPPGTGKGSLKDLINQHYSSGKVCSADLYFNRPFAEPRTRDSLKVSHEFCKKKVIEACSKNLHPIIVVNTHMRKWEMKPYFELALKYSYTVILAETPRKFETDPKVLERSNQKGLTESYLRRRVKQWEEMIPPYTGWMLSPCDGNNIQKYFMNLALQLKDTEFREKLSISEQEDVFKQEKMLYCAASYYKGGVYSKEKFHLSDDVQAMYGKMFTLIIKGFIITDKLFLGIVPLDEKQLSLIYKEDNSISNQFESLIAGMNIQDMPEEIMDLDLEKISCKSTFKEEDQEGDNINTTTCSFIILGKVGETTSHFPYIKDVEAFRKQLFSDSDIVGPDGMLLLKGKDSFHLKDTRVYRVKNCVWLLLPECQLSVQSVFTGIYL